jgi:hypothetical protein
MNNSKGFEMEAEGESEQEAGIYLSISDLMSSLFLFFALLFITVPSKYSVSWSNEVQQIE